jgi:hypothetical protein
MEPQLMLQVQLDAGEKADMVALDSQVSTLASDIRLLEDVSVARAQESAILGARGDPISTGTLLIALFTGGAFTAIIQALRDWALRAEYRKVSIKATINGNTIELEYSPSAINEKELLAFVAKIKAELGKPKKKRG